MLEDVDRRLVLVVLVLLALAGGTVASAAQLPFTNGRIAAGSSAVSHCDASVTASLTLSGSAVSAVAVGDVAAACAGGALTATLTQSGAVLATLAPVTVPSGGGTVTIAVPAPQPAAANVTDVRVVVVGP